MNIGIVGAGISGLTVAHELLKRGHTVTIYEREHPGGLAGGIPFPGLPGVYLDKYYHHFFTHDAPIIRLIHEHNLTSELIWNPTVSGIYTKDRAWKFSTPWDLLSFSPLGNLWQRLCMGLILYYFKRTKDWQHLDNISCKEFFEKKGSSAGYKNLWEPLLRKKFGDAANEISAAFLWGRIHPRSRSRKKTKEVLGYIRGGMQRLVNAMVEHIARQGGSVQVHAPVKHVIPGPKPCIISDAGKVEFDRVVWTASIDVLAGLTADIPLDIADMMRGVSYMQVTCLICVMKKKQDSFYWLNTIDADMPFGIVVEHTNFIPADQYQNKHIMYIVNYHQADWSLRGLSAEQLMASYMPSIKNIMPQFSMDDVASMYLCTDTHGSPVYSLRFSKDKPPYRGWLPGVDICCMGQEYPEDRNINAFVKNACKYVAQYY